MRLFVCCLLYTAVFVVYCTQLCVCCLLYTAVFFLLYTDVCLLFIVHSCVFVVYCTQLCVCCLLYINGQCYSVLMSINFVSQNVYPYYYVKFTFDVMVELLFILLFKFPWRSGNNEK